jgi:protein-arginine kinase activator protein McsA
MAFTSNRKSVSLRTTVSSCLPPRHRVILSAQLENRDGHPDEIQKGDKLTSAFDAQHTFWKALLALMWPLILVWRMVLATVRTLDEAAVIAQHIHAHQSTQYLASPSSKGNNSLDWDLLRQQIQLSAAMNREDYDAALKIKAAIVSLQSRRTNDLATQLLHMSSKMREDIKDIRAAQNESNLSSLQRLIQDAVEEQDFARAAILHKQLLELAPPPPPSPRADLEYLEWDTKKRVAQALANEKLIRQDPIHDLTAHLAELLLEEDFRKAAKVHAQLKRLQNDRDMQALMHKVSILQQEAVLKQKMLAKACVHKCRVHTCTHTPLCTCMPRSVLCLVRAHAYVCGA